MRVQRRWVSLVVVVCLSVVNVVGQREQPDPDLEQQPDTCGEFFTCNRKTEFCDHMVQQCVRCESICPGTSYCSVYCPNFTLPPQPQVPDSPAQNHAQNAALPAATLKSIPTIDQATAEPDSNESESNLEIVQWCLIGITLVVVVPLAIGIVYLIRRHLSKRRNTRQEHQQRCDPVEGTDGSDGDPHEGLIIRVDSPASAIDPESESILSGVASVDAPLLSRTTGSPEPASLVSPTGNPGLVSLPSPSGSPGPVSLPRTSGNAAQPPLPSPRGNPDTLQHHDLSNGPLGTREINHHNDTQQTRDQRTNPNGDSGLNMATGHTGRHGFVAQETFQC